MVQVAIPDNEMGVAGRKLMVVRGWSNLSPLIRCLLAWGESGAASRCWRCCSRLRALCSAPGSGIWDLGPSLDLLDPTPSWTVAKRAEPEAGGGVEARAGV